MKTDRFLKILYDYVAMLFGAVIFTMAWGLFVIPNGMSAGGVTGMSAIIQFISAGKIPASVSYAVINAILLLAGFAVLGKGFGVRTVFCVIISSVLLELWSRMPAWQAVDGNFLYIPERVLIPLIGGLLESLGIMIIFNHGGSTGGTDIVALAVNKYWPITPGKLFLYVDAIIIACILFVPGKSFSDMIYGYIMMFTFSMALDLMMLGRQSTVKLLVFSEKYEEIAEYINKTLDRGVTVINATGWYTGKDKKVLLVLVRRRQLKEIEKFVKEIDSRAFMSVSKTSAVYGEGFEEIKTGIKKKLNNGN
ncbi:MAG: YitT family protein [Bacteroidales bacterium]|nr:YitT family protein [Bacteroidales bacterium]